MHTQFDENHLPIAHNENEQCEIAMFGVLSIDLIEAKPPFVDDLMYAMGILSDAQHVLEMGCPEIARQYMNRAKFFIGNYRSEHRVGR